MMAMLTRALICSQTLDQGFFHFAAFEKQHFEAWRVGCASFIMRAILHFASNFNLFVQPQAALWQDTVSLLPVDAMAFLGLQTA
jgi:hypothetical protein